MILVAAPMTYLCLMQGFSAARIPRRSGSTIEDQQLRTGPTISIVDDDESMRCAVKSLVTSLGFAACTFASAEEFLHSPRLDDTDCLITDLQMPGLSGIELQKSLLAQDRHIPIIFMTAFPEERMRTRAMEAGALGFLSKPFETQTLITLIDKAIETSRKN
jgi:FixJ family two-component response regulator